jgi:osmoprotectant transport system ATP-binding protein
MSVAPVVELRQVSKVYLGGVRAVDEVTFRLPPGRVLALLGPSGCGKTTTLRLLNRLEEATSGEVRVRGQDVRSQRPEQLRRSIGYIIQEGGLFPHRDVSANVATVPRLLGWPRQKVRQRVAAVLDLVGLTESVFGRRLPAELSGGQRQRVGVARALAADPDILLMDEPFGALDPGTRETLQEEFLRLQAELRKAVVIVTHDLAEAGKLADEIVVMDQGRILQEGSLRELLLRPAGERVRAFLGRQGQGLALEALRLSHVLEGMPQAASVEKPLRMARDLRLGQVLLALADASPGMSVLVEGDGGGAFDALALRDRLLEELRPLEGSANAQRAAGIIPDVRAFRRG